MASSSSEECTASSGDEQEAQPLLPQKKLRAAPPSPPHQQSTDEEEDSEEEDSSDSEEAPPPPVPQARVLTKQAPSDKSLPAATTKPITLQKAAVAKEVSKPPIPLQKAAAAKVSKPPPPPPHQQSTDEEEDSEQEDSSDSEDVPPPVPQAQVLTKQAPSDKRLPAATTKPITLQKAAVAKEVSKPPIPLQKVAAAKEVSKPPPPHKAAAECMPDLPKAVNVPPADLTQPPSLLRWLAAAGLVELPESSMSEKGVGKWPAASPAVREAAAALLPPPPKINAAAGPMDYEAQRLLPAKIEKYWFLWTMLESVEQDYGQPGMFQLGFLKMDDAKATMLEDKIQKQMASELGKRCSLKFEVENELRNAMK
ncbi:unnamed protein product [Urochloa humidicola]